MVSKPEKIKTNSALAADGRKMQKESECGYCFTVHVVRAILFNGDDCEGVNAICSCKHCGVFVAWAFAISVACSTYQLRSLIRRLDR